MISNSEQETARGGVGLSQPDPRAAVPSSFLSGLNSRVVRVITMETWYG